MLSHPLLPKLKQLRLSGIAATLEERAAMASANAMRPVDFLALLLDDELDRRQQSSFERLVHKACFEEVKLLSDFDFAAAPNIDRSLVTAMATCQFIRNKENWLLCGQTGLGKSHLAIAIGFEAIKRGHTVRWANTHELLEELFAARADNTYRSTLKNILAVDLLILDEFGLMPVSEQGAQDLYDIIHKRYERASIVLTTNLGPTEWNQVFGHGLLAAAALDRLTHHARITVITGPSYRQRSRRKDEAQPSSANPGAAIQVATTTPKNVENES